MIINFNLTKEEVDELEISPICLDCNHREMFHNQDREENDCCLIPNCICNEFIEEGDTSYWSIDRYNSIYNDSVSKALRDKIIQQLESLKAWSRNEDAPALESESRTIRIQRYNKFKLPE